MPLTRRSLLAAATASTVAGCSPPDAAVSQETPMSDPGPLATRAIPATPGGSELLW